MSRLIPLLTAAAIMAALQGVAHNTAAQDSSGNPAQVEAEFHRAQARATTRIALPQPISQDKWEAAFLGKDGALPAQHYVARLMDAYYRHPKHQFAVVQLMHGIIGDLVERKDAAMVLRVAVRYIAPSRGNRDIFDTFKGSQRGFARSITHFENVLDKAFWSMKPDEQKEFRQAMIDAIFTSLVTVTGEKDGTQQYHTRHVDLVHAILGYKLLMQLPVARDMQDTVDKEVLSGLRSQLKGFRFTTESLVAFLEPGGLEVLQGATAGFLKGEYTSLAILLKMGIEVEPSAATVLVSKIRQYVNQPRDYNYALSVIDGVHFQADDNTKSGRTGTLAQRMVDAGLSKVLSDVLTPQRVADIYRDHYIKGIITRNAETYRAARTKGFIENDAGLMEKEFSRLLDQLVKKPAGYYQMVNDFSGNEHFNKARFAHLDKMTGADMAAHFQYLGQSYIDEKSLDARLILREQLRVLIKSDAVRTEKTPAQPLRMKELDFRLGMMRMARKTMGDGDKNDRLTAILTDANNLGWGALVGDGLVTWLRSALKLEAGMQASETLNTIQRVNAERRMRERQWKRGTVTTPANKR
jgi:hypothetical protein